MLSGLYRILHVDFLSPRADCSVISTQKEGADLAVAIETKGSFIISTGAVLRML